MNTINLYIYIYIYIYIYSVCAYDFLSEMHIFSKNKLQVQLLSFVNECP